MLTRLNDGQTIQDKELNIHVDTCGNVYLQLRGENMISQSNEDSNPYLYSESQSFPLYQININNKDEIYFEDGNYEIINDEDNEDDIESDKDSKKKRKKHKKKQMLRQFSNVLVPKNSRKKKVRTNNDNDDNNNDDDDDDNNSCEENSDEENSDKDVNEDNEDNDNEDYENYDCDYDYENNLKKENNKIFPEMKKYKILPNHKYKLKTDEFSFAKMTNDIEINKRMNGTELALYDTLIYNSKGSVIFKSSADDYVLYRLNIYHDGRLVFRPIGGTNKHYAVYLDNDLVPKLIRI